MCFSNNIVVFCLSFVVPIVRPVAPLLEKVRGIFFSGLYSERTNEQAARRRLAERLNALAKKFKLRLRRDIYHDCCCPLFDANRNREALIISAKRLSRQGVNLHSSTFVPRFLATVLGLPPTLHRSANVVPIVWEVRAPSSNHGAAFF